MVSTSAGALGVAHLFTGITFRPIFRRPRWFQCILGEHAACGSSDLFPWLVEFVFSSLPILITPSGKISLFLVMKSRPGFAMLFPARTNWHEEEP